MFIRFLYFAIVEGDRANVKAGKPPMFHPALSSSATDGIVTWARIDIGRGRQGVERTYHRSAKVR